MCAQVSFAEGGVNFSAFLKAKELLELSMIDHRRRNVILKTVRRLFKLLVTVLQSVYGKLKSKSECWELVLRI